MGGINGSLFILLKKDKIMFIPYGYFSNEHFAG